METSTRKRGLSIALGAISGSGSASENARQDRRPLTRLPARVKIANPRFGLIGSSTAGPPGYVIEGCYAHFGEHGDRGDSLRCR